VVNTASKKIVAMYNQLFGPNQFSEFTFASVGMNAQAFVGAPQTGLGPRYGLSLSHFTQVNGQLRADLEGAFTGIGGGERVRFVTVQVDVNAGDTFRIERMINEEGNPVLIGYRNGVEVLRWTDARPEALRGDGLAGWAIGAPNGVWPPVPLPAFDSWSGGEFNTSDVTTVTVTGVINPVNDAPTVANPIGDVTVAEDADSTIDLSSTFSDPDISTNGDTLTLSVAGNDNSSLVNAYIAADGVTLVLDYQPGQTGTAAITVRATDLSGLFIETTFIVTVEAHTLPVITNVQVLNPAEAYRGGFLHISYQWEGEFTNGEHTHGILLISTSLLASLTVDDLNFMMHNDPTESFTMGLQGAWSIGVPVTGDGLSNGHDIDLEVTDFFQPGETVVPVVWLADGNHGALGGYIVGPEVTVLNHEPVADPQSVSTNEDTPVTITLSGSDADAADSGSLSFSILDSSSLEGTLEEGPNPGEFIFTPNANFSGSTSFTFMVSDGFGGISNIATVEITVNPVNDAPTLNVIADQTVDEGGTLTLQVSASDLDNDPLAYALQNAPSWLSIDAATGVITGTAGTPGNYSVTVTATDPSNSSATQTLNITVNAVQPPSDTTPPVISSVTLTRLTSSEARIAWTTNEASDAQIEYGLTIDYGSFTSLRTTLRTSHSRELSGLEAGTLYHARLLSRDQAGNLAVSDDFTFTTEAVNQTPTANAQSATTDEENSITITLTGSDPDGNALTYAIAQQPSNGTVSDPVVNSDGTVTVVYTPNTNFNGADSFTFTVNDGTVDSAAAAVDITVNAVNDAPWFNPMLFDRGAKEGSELVITVSATDLDGDPLTFSASDLPSGAVFDPDTRTFTWTPNFDQAGTYAVKFSVTDGSASATVTVLITVNNVNRAPLLNAIGNQTVNAGSLLSFTVTASDPDANDALTFSATGLPSGAALDALTGAFSWTPTPNQIGNHTVTFTVTDASGASVAETVTITVNQTPGTGSIPLEVGGAGSALTQRSDGSWEMTVPVEQLTTLTITGTGRVRVSGLWRGATYKNRQIKLTAWIKDAESTKKLTITVGTTTYTIWIKLVRL